MNSAFQVLPGKLAPSRDPAWYRGLRFICIWACLAFVTANAALLLTRVAPTAAQAPPQATQSHPAGERPGDAGAPAAPRPRMAARQEAGAAQPAPVGFL